MKGLIFVFWEKYLDERFGSPMLGNYRRAIGESTSNLPLATRIYPDEVLLKGVTTACDMTKMPLEQILFEFGRYFLINGLVEHLCGYLLSQAWSGYDLLLLMRDAHAQMRRTPDGLTPPLFAYEILSNEHNHMILTYDSHRQLCSLLNGAIHGAAERFGERAHTRELQCMKHGAATCKFEVFFEGQSWAKTAPAETIEQEKQRLSKQDLANLVLRSLPGDAPKAMTLPELQQAINRSNGGYHPDIYRTEHRLFTIHLSQLYSAITKLQQVGLVSSSANTEGDTLNNRRYWRTPTEG
jgi:DNA-binding PadR family transcriptional regulator